jgi:formylglycine-generating enzyme required for sulfatase activity/energy-coupling factor transporter ATP-binding protein EcfA2
VDIDIAQLAQQVVTILIPYLVKGGEAFAGETGKRLAGTLWEKFKPKVEAKESTKEALQDVKDAPDDKGALASFEHQIKKILERDTKFAEEVSITIGDIDLSSIQAGDKSVIVKGSITNSRVIYAETYVEGSVYKGPVPHNPQDALKAYRTVMASLTSSISMRGIDLTASDPNTQRAIGLANVYIDLDTTTQIEFKETDGRIKKRAKDMADATGLSAEIEAELLRREGKTNPLSSLQAVVDNQFLVIKGDPGSGKSTFVSFLTYCLSTNTTERLKYWKKEDADLLPVIVILRDFVKAFKKLPEQAEPHHIWDFIEKRLKDQNLSKASKPIQELLEEGKVILFLDGLDEVSTIPQRVFVRDAVHAFVKRFSKNHFVVTSRILSYVEPKQGEPNLRLTGFPEFELAPFDDEKIRSFIDLWHKELTGLGVVTPEIASELNLSLKTAVRRRELSKLAPNPLLLTVMAVVNTHKGRLPDARALLYKETVEILLWQWEQSSKGQEAARLRQLMLEAECADADLEQVICKLAFEAHAQTDGNSEDPETLAGISELSLQKGLASINKGDLNWAANVIETMKLRAGLLLERDNNVFTFPHRSFQEFLAGTYLDSKDDFVALAKELADNQLLWRQVILWAVSRRVYIRGSIDGPLALVAELCPSRDCKEEKEWSRVWLAGDILLEIGLNRAERSELGKDLLPRLQNRLKELLEQSHLTPRERAEAGDTLAKLGDPRPGVTPLPSGEGLGVRSMNLLFCEIPAGKFKMGSNKKNDADAYDDEEPQFEYNIEHNYFMSRYPVTNAQFDLFVNDPGGYVNEKWYTDAGKKWLKQAKQDKPPKSGGGFDLPNHPVVNVTWYEAVAFCKWLTKQMQNDDFAMAIYDPATGSIRMGDNLKSSIVNRKYEVRLPTEAEWEKAARGEKGLRYPWGDNFDQERVNCNMIIGSTSPVGCFSTGQSKYGLLDMSGNVWEWCATQSTDGYKSYDKNENNDLEGELPRVLRGGAFSDDERLVRCAFRLRLSPNYRGNYFGFRVVVVASPISL